MRRLHSELLTSTLKTLDLPFCAVQIRVKPQVGRRYSLSSERTIFVEIGESRLSRIDENDSLRVCCNCIVVR